MLWVAGWMWTPDEFYVLPCPIIECVKCDEDECNDVHGWGFVFRWLWMGLYVGVMFDIEDEV